MENVDENGQPTAKTKEGAIPLHVLVEERERRRSLENEVALMKEMIRDMKMANSVKEDGKSHLDEYIDKFDDDTKKGIDAFIEKKLTKERGQIKEAIGTLLDRNDKLELQVVAGRDYDRYAKKVEAEVAEYRQRGQLPPPRQAIFKTLKDREIIEKYNSMEREAAKKARDPYMDDMEARQYSSPRSDDSSEDFFSGINSQSASNPQPKRKSFKDMSIEEKQKALSNIEL